MFSWLAKIFTLRTNPKKIAWWTGADAIRLVVMPPISFISKIRIINTRIFWKIAHRAYNEHWVNHAELSAALIDFGVPVKKIKIKPTPFGYPKFKKNDKAFKVLFYVNRLEKKKEFIDWIYGVEYLEELEKHFNVLLVEGKSMPEDFFPKSSVFVKINRTKYNGMNITGKICIANKIPVYAVDAYKNDFEKNVEDLIKWITTKKDMWRIKNAKKDNSKNLSKKGIRTESSPVKNYMKIY